MSHHAKTNEALRDLTWRYNKHGRGKQVEDDWLNHWAHREPDIEATLLLHLRMKDTAVIEEAPVEQRSIEAKAWRLVYFQDAAACLFAVVLFYLCAYRPATWYTQGLVVATTFYGIIKLFRGYSARWDQFVLYGTGVSLLASTSLDRVVGWLNLPPDLGTGFLELTPQSDLDSVVRVIGGIVLMIAGWKAKSTGSD